MLKKLCNLGRRGGGVNYFVKICYMGKIFNKAFAKLYVGDPMVGTINLHYESVL